MLFKELPRQPLVHNAAFGSGPLFDGIAMFVTLMRCTGSYNKVFENGTEAIARIPCALVGNVRKATAREVATME